MSRKSTKKIVLSIAGSDSSGGAGIQADLKTFTAFNCFGMTVLTAVTAQNSQKVSKLHIVPPEIVASQITALIEDYDLSAIKIGMVASNETAKVIAKTLKAVPNIPIILDTPMRASTGTPLIEGESPKALIENLCPIATLITPNLDEAAALLGGTKARSHNDMINQSKQLHERGAKAVYLKGGHLTETAPVEAVDVFYDGAELRMIKAPWVDVPHRHGTGCVLSAAIAASLAQGEQLISAIEMAKSWLTNCLQASSAMQLGTGPGPVNILKMPNFQD